MVIVLAGGLLLVGLLAWFYLLEIDGRRHTIFVVLAVVFLVEAVIAGGGEFVPVGILRPQFGGQDFRPPDLVIVAAIGAHMLAARIGRIGPVSFAWFPFVAVYAGGVAVGFLNSQAADLVLFEGKALLYIVGGALVASGADLERLMSSIGSVGVVLASVVLFAFVLRTAGIELTINTPVQDFPRFGALSADTITILVALGAIVIVAESVRANPSYLRLVAGIVLLLAPVSSQQRASYLSLVATLVVLVFLVGGRTWSARSSVRTVQVGLVTAVLMVVPLVGYLASGSSGVVVSSLEDTFGGTGKQESAEARTTLYSEALDLIGENPIFGTGLGAQVTATVTAGELTTPAHNVFLEMLMRVGIVGLTTFVIAVGVTWVLAVRVWRGAPGAAIASVGAGVAIIFAAVLAKAMVEPAISKFRLALVLGIALGALASAERTLVPDLRRRWTSVGRAPHSASDTLGTVVSSGGGVVT